MALQDFSLPGMKNAWDEEYDLPVFGRLACATFQIPAPFVAFPTAQTGCITILSFLVRVFGRPGLRL